METGSTQREVRDANFFWKLFSSTFLISAFTVGGGYIIIPLLRAKYVDEYGWLDDKEVLDMVAIAQSMPGIVAVNACIILGYRMAGLRGSIAALLGTTLPPLITIGIIARCYDVVASNPTVQMALKGMQCGATALIVNVAIDLFRKQMKKKLVIPILIVLATFIANIFFDVNIMLLVIIDGLVGLVLLHHPKYNG